jgi:hypothetical protein
VFEAEVRYLKPRGWNIDQFNKRGIKGFTPSRFEEIDNELEDFQLEIDLLLAGFDHKGIGHIFTIDGNKGVVSRQDIPGFCSIGAGSIAAQYMMFYRGLSPIFKTRQALYFIIEAKTFAELAPSVGLKTDLRILRYNKKPLIISENTMRNTLAKIFKKLGNL